MSDALDAFMETAQRIVYCSLATVDRRGRPRSRLVHAVWERPEEDELVGWVGSRPTAMRRAHIRANPFVSCFYWDPAHDVAVAECKATWIEDNAGRRDAWGRLSAAPEPRAPRPWRQASRTSSGPKGVRPLEGGRGLADPALELVGPLDQLRHVLVGEAD